MPEEWPLVGRAQELKLLHRLHRPGWSRARRPYNVALIVLDPDAAAAYAARAGLPDPSPAALCGNGDVWAQIGAAVDRANATLSRVEQVKVFTLLGVDWLPGGNELTPTMRLRRRSIDETYRTEIEKLYPAAPVPVADENG